ncbi:protein dead ringer homolog isoform X9 [Mytilus californianus]|uniref:protein dead ringer homolog isoform X9 n=1 Tax=Mytilus californianus TaxID=6549 RepID=UPI00224783BB|nr:protein dead ringer homolog isoform X9 [Mytilus californianus]
MSNGEISPRETLTNGDLNESELSSENGSSDKDMDDVSREKLDPADRELYEKMKKQEREERIEIERELKRAHEEAILRRRHEELRVKDMRLHGERRHSEDRGEDLRINKHHDDLRALRDNHLLKSESDPRLDLLNQAYLERYRNNISPMSATSISPTNVDGPSHHWTFEEQFKQLYELSDEPKRREFLDDLFQFMQKRGTPVNRIPIMAKQTLDLYELFRLVVSKGGLVEVINKKLWREITKGLNLPSSITSAAFTLRTQYMKYLYPYECEKLKLSSPQELQAAIDGNRREDRQSPLTSLQRLWQIQAQQLAGEEEDSIPPAHPHHRALAEHFTERDAIAMEAASRVMEHATRKMEEASRAAAMVAEEPPRKRLLTTEEERLISHVGMPSTHIKITSRNDGRSDIDNSLVVSMEINGIMYQGVLFAHNPRRL